jgi:hypothetical protein
MSLFGNVFSGLVKVALTPVAIVKDVVDVAKGDEPENTKALIESAGEDAKDAMDDLADGEII